MWAAMNFVTVLRGSRLLPLSPPLNAWKRLQTRSLNLSETKSRGQINLVQACVGSTTAAGAASLLAGEEWRRPNRYYSLHNHYYARSATTRQPFPGCAVLARLVRTRVVQAVVRVRQRC